jgi:transcriptional regulator with XRE-family HTH domain
MSSKNEIYTEEFLRNRIAELRDMKGISDRTLSFEIGRSKSYMHNIMSGRALPSFVDFVAICDYFGIEPKDFFDKGVENPILVNEIVDIIRKLDDEGLRAILSVLKMLNVNQA